MPSSKTENLESEKTDKKDVQDSLEGTTKSEPDILELTGNNGFWQLRVFLVLFAISIPGAGQNLAISFTAPDIDHWCARPPEAWNLSVGLWKETGLPQKDIRCSRYANLTLLSDENLTTGTVSTLDCETWEYDHSFYSATLVEEFDLVCSQGWLVSLAKSVFMTGFLVSVISGTVADKIGRRPTITGGCVLAFISSGICAFSTSFTMFLIARFFVAVGIGCYYNNLFVLLTEVVGSSVRSAYSNTVQIGWAVGFVCLPGVVWLIRDWFWIQIALTAPYCIFLAVWWMIPESPRWLLSAGKTKEARKMLLSAVKMNKRKISDLDKKLEEILSDSNKDVELEQESKGNLLDLLKSPELRQITLIIVFAWFVISFIYYALSFNTNELVGNPFVNFAASGFVEFPAYGFSIILIHYSGRRKSMAGTMILGGLACLLSYFVPKDPSWLPTILPAIGKFFITSCYGILYVFTLELFPTVIRSSGLSIALLFEEIGSMIAPFVRELGNATQPFVPFIVFGVLACMSGLLTLLLPETTNQKLPDTIKEATEVATARKCNKRAEEDMNAATI